MVMRWFQLMRFCGITSILLYTSFFGIISAFHIHLIYVLISICTFTVLRIPNPILTVLLIIFPLPIQIFWWASQRKTDLRFRRFRVSPSTLKDGKLSSNVKYSILPKAQDIKSPQDIKEPSRLFSLKGLFMSFIIFYPY